MEKLRVPKNLRIDKLVARHSTEEIVGFHKDKVYVVMHFIRNQMRRLNRKSCYPGHHAKYYVPLSADILRDVIGSSYASVLDWMVKAGLIETDGHYIVGEKCKYYRMTDHYLGSGSRWVTVVCKSIRSKNHIPTNYCGDHAIRHLQKWLSPEHLELDKEKAYKILEHQKKEKIQRYKGRNIELCRTNAELSCNLGKEVVDEINSSKIHCQQDAFGYRVHTPLTRLKKCLRPLVKCRAESLVQLDLKNSQLYFSLWLLNSQNWTVSNKNHREINTIYHNTLYSTGNNKNNYTTNTIMFLVSLETRYGKGLQEHQYCKDVCHGVLYERVVEHLDCQQYFPPQWEQKRKRKKVKKTLLAQLFANPFNLQHQQTTYNEGKIPVWNAFVALYPEIAEFFRIVKSNHYKQLCQLLQRIESYTMIAKVCQFLRKSHPQIPIYTIHDCLLTTERHVDTVREVMEIVIENFIGFPPGISVESWSAYEKKIPKALR